MGKKDSCFIHNGEIYYKIGSSGKDIDYGLKSMVDEFLEYEDFEELEEEIAIQAQRYLVLRQSELIIKKHCK